MSTLPTGSGEPSGWTECSVCGTGLKQKNLEGHVRKFHPKEYMDKYPDAPAQQGIAPCPVCWEWLSVEMRVPVRTKEVGRCDHRIEQPEFTAHIARKHPGEFGDKFPGECLLCALGLVHPFWPPTEPDDDAADFVWHSNGDDIRWEAAAAWLTNEVGVDVSEEAAKEHTEEHVLRATGPRATEEGAYVTEQARMHEEILGWRGPRPSAIESEIMEATEEGQVYTVAELAELIGRTDRGVRKRLEKAVEHGLLELVDGTRPATYRATGDWDYDERAVARVRDDSDPPSVPEDELPNSMESYHELHGGYYTPMGP